jgi:hypothetical protein
MVNVQFCVDDTNGWNEESISFFLPSSFFAFLTSSRKSTEIGLHCLHPNSKLNLELSKRLPCICSPELEQDVCSICSMHIIICIVTPVQFMIFHPPPPTYGPCGLILSFCSTLLLVYLI